MTDIELIELQEQDSAVLAANQALTYYLQTTRDSGREPEEFFLRLLAQDISDAVEAAAMRALAEEFLIDCE
jgi:hypothetical protein